MSRMRRAGLLMGSQSCRLICDRGTSVPLQLAMLNEPQFPFEVAKREVISNGERNHDRQQNEDDQGGGAIFG